MLEYHLGLRVRVDDSVHDALLGANGCSAGILCVVRPEEELLVTSLRQDLEDEVIVRAVWRSELGKGSAVLVDVSFFAAGSA